MHAICHHIIDTKCARIKSSHEIRIKHKIESIASVSIPLGIGTDHIFIVYIFSFGLHSNYRTTPTKITTMLANSACNNTLEATLQHFLLILYGVLNPVATYSYTVMRHNRHTHTQSARPYRIAHVCIIYNKRIMWHYISQSVSDEAEGKQARKKKH